MGRGILDEIKEKALITDVVQQFGMGIFQTPSYEQAFRGTHGTHPSSSDTHVHVDPNKGYWRCFSCNEGGSVIDWVLSVEFGNNRACLKEAAQRIAKELDIPFDDIVIDTPQYQAWQTLTQFAFQCNANLTLDSPIRAMIRAQWSLSDETIDQLCIGYSDHGVPDNIPHLDNVNAGLVDASGQASLRNRITFPYFMGAQVRWITGRYIGEPPEGIPKYRALQSTAYVAPILFNFDNAHRGAANEPLIITEGPADVAGAFNHGLRVVGVSSHTVRSEDVEDLLTLAKATSTVYIIMDSEESKAGHKGALRTAQILVNNGYDPYIVDLPREGKSKVDLCDFFKTQTPADLTAIIKGGFGDTGTPAKTLADLTIEECPERPQGSQYADVLKTFAMLSDAETDRYLTALRTRTGAKSVTILKKMMTDLRKDFNKQREHLELVEEYEEVPFLAQDYEYDLMTDMWKAHMCVYAPYAHKKFIDMEEVNDIIMTPLHVITGMQPNGEWSIIDRRPIHKPSSRVEEVCPSEKVLNFPAAHRYAWSFKSNNQWSIINFLHGKSPTLDLGGMYNALLGLFNDYVVYPDPRDAHILTLFTFFTYVFMGFSVTPYLHCHGPKASGKSTTLGLLSHLCFNAIASSSISTAAANRLIHANRPTLIMDEAERLKNPKPATAEYEIYAMALAGYTKSATSQAFRCDNTDQIRPTSFWTYCPKVFGSIGHLQSTLATRAIVVQCRALKKEEREAVKDFSKDEIYLADQFQTLRDQLHIFGITAFREIRERYDRLDKSKYTQLDSRPRQIWLPLLAIAEVIEEKGGLKLTRLVEDVINTKLQVAQIDELSTDFMSAAMLALWHVLQEDNAPTLLKLVGDSTYICAPEATRYITERLAQENNWNEKKSTLATYQVNRMLRDTGCIPSGAHSRSYVVNGMYGEKKQAHYPFDVNQLTYFLETKGINLMEEKDGG